MKKLKKKKENAIQVQAHGFNFHGESKVGPAATAPTHSHSHTSLKTQFCLFVCFAWHCRLPLSYFFWVEINCKRKGKEVTLMFNCVYDPLDLGIGVRLNRRSTCSGLFYCSKIKQETEWLMN